MEPEDDVQGCTGFISRTVKFHVCVGPGCCADDGYGHLQLKRVGQIQTFKNLVSSKIFPGQRFPGQITANTPYPHYTPLSTVLIWPQVRVVDICDLFYLCILYFNWVQGEEKLAPRIVEIYILKGNADAIKNT